MKKRFLFLCCLCLAVVLVGCQKNDSLDIDDDPPHIDDGYDEVREAAWDLLSAGTRKTVAHSWEDARVDVGEFDVYVLENSRYEKHYCYRVIFGTKIDPFESGPIVIFLDISTLEYIGTVLSL